MFTTDGSSHRGGVANEGATVNLLNSLSIYPSFVESRGGTKVKEDAIAGEQKISIKKKEGLSQGSFDWFNSSKYNYLFEERFASFIASMREMRSLPLEIRSDEEFIEKVRQKFSDLCEQALEELTADQIVEILKKGLVGDNEGLDVVINDVKTRRIYIFPATQHPAFELLRDGFVPVLKGSGKSSRQIVFTKGSETYNNGLRLRITSNNGIRAFLGLSKSNKNSQVVVKLQQDDVKSLILNTDAKSYDY